MVPYASEIWVLKENVINKLKTLERKILRKIYGPTRTGDGYWRIKTDQEINDILKGQNVIGFINPLNAQLNPICHSLALLGAHHILHVSWIRVKKQRLNWLGHVERMTEDNIVQKIKRWKPMSKRPIGRPKTRWEYDVLEGIRSVNVNNWKNNVAQKRDSWKKVAERSGTLCRL
jgi:hypothetical protein